jgi:aquaporin Z
MERNLGKVLLAEAIGAFTLSYIGVLAIAAGPLVGVPPGTVTLTSIAFAHGLAIAVMVAALGGISGGHFNPAITVGFVVARRMSMLRGLLYIIAQLAGATIASAILLALIGHAGLTAGVLKVAPGVGDLAATIIEGIGVFFLVLVVFGTAVDERAPRSVFPFAIGLTIVLDIMAFGPLTGSSVNPSRAFGPALVSGYWASQLVYWVGPVIAGGLAGALYQWVLRARAPKEVITVHGGEAPRKAA